VFFCLAVLEFNRTFILKLTENLLTFNQLNVSYIILAKYSLAKQLQ